MTLDKVRVVPIRITLWWNETRQTYDDENGNPILDKRGELLPQHLEPKDQSDAPNPSEAKPQTHHDLGGEG